MIDRIEELLAQMAAEDEDDGQEDALDLTGEDARRPAALERQEAENPADNSPEGDGLEAPEGASTGPDALTEESTEGKLALSWLETDGPAPLLPPESVSGGSGDGSALGTASREAVWEEPAAPTVREAASGLEALYRQTARETLPPAVLPASVGGQGGFGSRGSEPGTAASLAVDELDRAVRRDSRRYDGGMSIY